MNPANEAAPYQQEFTAVLAGHGTDEARGLSDAEARKRLRRYGKNELPAERRVPAWQKFLAQFSDALVILLLIATGISAGFWLYERQSALPYEALAILAIVLLNAAIGYIQESRAESAVAALKQMAAGQATVVRDGVRKKVPAAEIVTGDIILIEEGDTVPADARVIQSTSLKAAEAALTGESLPVAKKAAAIAGTTALGDRHNMIFAGTAVTYGRGRAVVVAIGANTEIGRIAGMLREAPNTTTPLQKELDRTGRMLGLAVLVIARRRDRDHHHVRARARLVGHSRCTHSGHRSGGCRGP